MTDLEALGKRLVACKHFRPMRGMRDLQGRTWTEDLLWRWNPICDVPDLSDPATVGCVLAMAREVWTKPEAFILVGDVQDWGKTMVAALEAAP